MLALVKNNADLGLLESFIAWLLIFVAVLMGIYLWTSYNAAPAGNRSVIEMVRGKASLYFLGGVVVLGMVVPFCVAVISLQTGDVSPVAILLASLCELIGGFSMRYSIFKTGAYAPLV